jgi:hypothetical protein
MNSFQITAAAARLLQQLTRNSNLNEPVPCVVWAEAGVALRILGGSELESRSLSAGWEVGFYEDSAATRAFTREVDGVRIVVEPQYWERLMGHTLDVDSGRLVVLPPRNAPQSTCDNARG